MKYEIIGEPMPVVVCDLEANEAMITERGSMVWMSPNMKMETAGTGVVVLYQLPSPLVRGTNAFNLKLDASALRILVISTSLVRVPYRGRW